MYYRKQTNEQLRAYKYPNLIAEIIESGYSICTCADHMGLGCHRQEDDQEVWGKLYGQEEMTASEALGLARLFGTDMGYLFADELRTMNGETFAHIRWYESNQRREREYQEYLKREEIMSLLRDRPYLLDFMMEAVRWSEEELNISIEMLREKKTA